MTKIPDAIREVAVARGDACHLSIEDKVKLAQDILEATDKHISELSKQQSIKFAEWMSNNPLDFQPAKGGKWIGADLVVLTAAELYPPFLNQSL